MWRRLGETGLRAHIPLLSGRGDENAVQPSAPEKAVLAHHPADGALPGRSRDGQAAQPGDS